MDKLLITDDDICDPTFCITWLYIHVSRLNGMADCWSGDPNMMCLLVEMVEYNAHETQQK